jgi:prepilin-type N-terminal cleavage/methylation domain-containing protein/prepilin-type processing-associated H-X9-DG protein
MKRSKSIRFICVQREAGFTLVELLLAIVVIAILAGLLLPVLSKAQARARTIQCLNNMKQLQLAWHTYADDNDDRISPNCPLQSAGKYPLTASWVSGRMTYETRAAEAPFFSDSTNTALLVPGGYGSIGAYTKTRGIYKCPADKSWIEIGGQRHPRVRSVSMNQFMDGGDNDPGHFYWCYFAKMSDILNPAPSEAFVFVDEHEDTIEVGSFHGVYHGRLWPDMYWANLPASRHTGAGTFSFADGHAEIRKWLDPRTLVPVERRVRWNWYYDGHSPQNRDALWLWERTTSVYPDKPN